MTASDPEREGNGEGQSQDEHEDPPELDVETAFAAIVAAWESDDAPAGRVPWPDAENVEAAGTAPTVERAGPREPDPSVERRAAGREPPAALTEPPTPVGPAAPPEPAAAVEPMVPGLYPVGGVEEPEDAERDRFVPPDPPPVPRPDLITRLAWVGVIGGPCLLLLAALVWRDLPELLLLGAVGSFVAGFVTLVARMPHERDGDDGDGAVV